MRKDYFPNLVEEAVDQLVSWNPPPREDREEMVKLYRTKLQFLTEEIIKRGVEEIEKRKLDVRPEIKIWTVSGSRERAEAQNEGMEEAKKSLLSLLQTPITSKQNEV